MINIVNHTKKGRYSLLNRVQYELQPYIVKLSVHGAELLLLQQH